MKESVNKLKVFLYVSFVLSLLCAALFTVSMFTAFDADVGYFDSHALITYIQTALAVISAVFFASIIFIIPKGSLPESAPENTVITVFASLLCGFIYISGMIMLFFSTYNSAAGMLSASRNLFLTIIVTGFVASVYFIYEALASEKKGLALKIVSSLFVIVNLILTVIYEHLDYFVAINTPRKVLLFIAYVSFVVFLVQELRFKTGIAQPRAYVFFGMTTVLLCSTMSIPGIIAHYAGVLKDSSFLIYYLIGFAFAIYTAIRLIAYVKYCEYVSESPISDEITDIVAENGDNSEV